MPDPARLLTTLQRAVDAFRATAGRRGRIVDLQGAAEVLVAGDLHGNLDNFRRLLQIANLARNPARHFVLQEAIHGPHRYPAGGDRSHQLLDLIAALKCQHPSQVHFLIGNHELAQATGRRIAKDNLELNDLFISGIRTAYGERADDVYKTYLCLIAAAPLARARLTVYSSVTACRRPHFFRRSIRPRWSAMSLQTPTVFPAARSTPSSGAAIRAPRRRRLSWTRWAPICSSRATFPAKKVSTPPMTAN